VTPLGIVVFSLLCGLAAVMGAMAIYALIKVLLPGPHRDRRDEDRVLLTYVDTWDLPGPEISRISRLSIGRTYCAILRLESQGLLDSYWHGSPGSRSTRTRRYVLTNLGREAVYDLERAKIDEIHNDRHGA
jgi:hypothetical protein